MITDNMYMYVGNKLMTLQCNSLLLMESGLLSLILSVASS